jgi:hypothetical protein
MDMNCIREYGPGWAALGLVLYTAGGIALLTISQSSYPEIRIPGGVCGGFMTATGVPAIAVGLIYAHCCMEEKTEKVAKRHFCF